MNLWFLWQLYVRMYPLTRSRSLPLPLPLWWLIIIIFASLIGLGKGSGSSGEGRGCGCNRSRDDFLFQLFLYHLLVMELEAILAVYQADLAVLKADEVQDAPEAVDLVDQRALQDHQRR